MSGRRVAFRNAGMSALAQLVNTLIGFATRTVFIHTLGAGYLGVNGFFTSVLTALSFAELGVGTAMTFALYRPLAESDRPGLLSLMTAYANIYRIIAIAVGVIGGGLGPFLHLLMKDTPNIPHVLLLYYVFLANSVAGYLLSYSRSLLIASQNVHLDVMNRTAFLILQSSLQIAVLLLLKSYMLYLVIQFLCQLVANIHATWMATRLFPGTLLQKGPPLRKEVKAELKKNVGGMVYHKLASAVVSASTTMFISFFVGVVAVGIYSNYALITGMAVAILSQAMTALAPTVGSVNILSGKEASEALFDRLFWLNGVLVGAATACLASLLNPFIRLWAGDQFLMEPMVTLVVVLNFYLYGIRQTALTYINACGLFWVVRYKSLAEACLTILVSIVLMGFLDMGVLGALLSVTISTVATNIWWEPYAVAREIFGRGLVKYAGAFIRSEAVAGGATAGAVWFSSLVSIDGWLGWVLKGCVAAVVAGAVYLVVYARRREVRAVASRIRGCVRR